MGPRYYCSLGFTDEETKAQDKQAIHQPHNTEVAGPGFALRSVMSMLTHRRPLNPLPAHAAALPTLGVRHPSEMLWTLPRVKRSPLRKMHRGESCWRGSWKRRTSHQADVLLLHGKFHAR